jgi:hypothetical protein
MRTFVKVSKIAGAVSATSKTIASRAGLGMLGIATILSRFIEMLTFLSLGPRLDRVEAGAGERREQGLAVRAMLPGSSTRPLHTSYTGPAGC